MSGCVFNASGARKEVGGIVPLYEYILRSDDLSRTDEVRVSDRAGLRKGDTLTVANRRWKVHSVEPPPRGTNLTRGRIVLVRDDS